MKCVPFATFLGGYIAVFGIKISDIKYFLMAKILMLFQYLRQFKKSIKIT
jgi:hypothetical protein